MFGFSFCFSFAFFHIRIYLLLLHFWFCFCLCASKFSLSSLLIFPCFPDLLILMLFLLVLCVLSCSSLYLRLYFFFFVSSFICFSLSSLSLSLSFSSSFSLFLSFFYFSAMVLCFSLLLLLGPVTCWTELLLVASSGPILSFPRKETTTFPHCTYNFRIWLCCLRFFLRSDRGWKRSDLHLWNLSLLIRISRESYGLRRIQLLQHITSGLQSKVREEGFCFSRKSSCFLRKLYFSQLVNNFRLRRHWKT